MLRALLLDLRKLPEFGKAEEGGEGGGGPLYKHS